MAHLSGDQPSRPERRPFREVAIASGLVTAADLEAAEAAARARPAADGPPDDAALAKALVEQGKLTPFQAREILAGRRRFRLGQYTVIDEIGRGGMGQVFKAEHALMGRHVAVKVLPRSKATPESEAAFRQEMRLLGRLDHENLVRAFDAGYDAMVYYLVTELVPGIDLRRQVRTYGPLDATAAASVFAQVARGLAFAHAQRIVHRDVKPGNILVMDDGRAKVLDLGLAGSTLEAEAIRLGRVVGTMDYIAPEQIRTPDAVGPPADIYALGCTMYYTLAGEVPFPGGTRKEKMRRHLTEKPTPLHQLAPHLPKPLCHLVDAMMAKSATDRIQSADEVSDRLARWAPERPIPLSRQPLRSAAAGLSQAENAAESSNSATVNDPAWPIADQSLPLDDLPPGPQESVVIDAQWPRAPVPRASAPAPQHLATAAQILVPAMLAGAGFAIALSLARTIDSRRFDELFGGFTPAVCGWVAFLLMAAVQAASRFGRQFR